MTLSINNQTPSLSPNSTVVIEGTKIIIDPKFYIGNQRKKYSFNALHSEAAFLLGQIIAECVEANMDVSISVYPYPMPTQS